MTTGNLSWLPDSAKWIIVRTALKHAIIRIEQDPLYARVPSRRQLQKVATKPITDIEIEESYRDLCKVRHLLCLTYETYQEALASKSLGLAIEAQKTAAQRAEAVMYLVNQANGRLIE